MNETVRSVEPRIHGIHRNQPLVAGIPSGVNEVLLSRSERKKFHLRAAIQITSAVEMRSPEHMRQKVPEVGQGCWVCQVIVYLGSMGIVE